MLKKRIRDWFWRIFDAFASLAALLSAPTPSERTVAYFQCKDCDERANIHCAPSSSGHEAIMSISGCKCPPRLFVI